MATSGSTSFKSNRDKVVQRALRLVGATTSGSVSDADDVNDANDSLNAMIKTWQMDGLSWTFTFIKVTLVAGQASYDLGLTTTDGVVYLGTSTKAARPTHIQSVVRRSTDNNDTPVEIISRNDYMNIPNKTTRSRVNQVYYDPQMTLGKLYVWPSPDTSGDVLILNADRPLQDMNSDTDDFDFPQEWIEVLSYGLAVRIAPEYGLSIGERNLLISDFTILKNQIELSDRGDSSTYFTVG
jgi:hypothetical protein